MYNIQAPWVGKTPEEYFGREPETEYDEDFEYESWYDMKMEEDGE